jgi:hypothetical protein
MASLALPLCIRKAEGEASACSPVSSSGPGFGYVALSIAHEKAFVAVMFHVKHETI